MYNHQTLTLAVVFISYFSLNAAAGTKIVIQSNIEGKSKAESSMLIQGNKLRMSYSDKNDNSNSEVIFNHKSQSMIAIDPKNKSYILFEAAQLASIKAQVDAAKQQMEAQLAKMPEEQQKMMREMMAGKIGIGKKKTKPVKKIIETSNKSSAAGYDCQYVEVQTNGVKKRELCITPWSALKNGAEVKVAMQGMMIFFDQVKESVGQFAESDDMPFSEVNELGGFPVIFKEFKNGVVIEQSRLKSISDESMSDELFNPPKGYKKQSLENMM